MVFLRKKKLLLSPLDCSFFKETLFYFSIVLDFFCTCCDFLFFCFFCSVFSGVFILLKVFPDKNISFKKCLPIKYWFLNFLLNLFSQRAKTLNKKKGGWFCSKIIILIFFRKTLLREKLFQDPHALGIACAIEGSFDHCCVSWRSWASQVHVHSFVIDPGCGTSVASSRLSPFSVFFFSKKKKRFMFRFRKIF